MRKISEKQLMWVAIIILTIANVSLWARLSRIENEASMTDRVLDAHTADDRDRRFLNDRIDDLSGEVDKLRKDLEK